MLEDQLVSLLKGSQEVTAIVSGRIFPMPAPQGVASPFLTYQLIGLAPSGRHYEGGAVHDITGVQIDCWDDDNRNPMPSRHPKIVMLAHAVRRALHGMGSVGDEVIDGLQFDDWRDLNTPEQARRQMDFSAYVRTPT